MMVTPTWSWLLTQWSLEPTVFAGLIALSAWYLYACGYLPAMGTESPKRPRLASPAQLRLFVLSVVVLVFALLSPLDYVGDTYLFSAHMIQHLLLSMVWPLLFLLSLPEEVVAPLLAPFGRRIGTLAMAFPAVAFLLFNVDIAIWHLPSWYDLTLRNVLVHVLEHLTFMAAGILVWWPIVAPIKRQRMSFGAQELYLFANLFPMMGLGVFFSFYQHPLYSPYIHVARLWGMSAVTDQQIGGLIMWMPGTAPFVLAMAGILIVWFDRGDPREESQRQQVTEGGIP